MKINRSFQIQITLSIQKIKNQLLLIIKIQKNLREKSTKKNIKYKMNNRMKSNNPKRKDSKVILIYKKETTTFYK